MRYDRTVTFLYPLFMNLIKSLFIFLAPIWLLFVFFQAVLLWIDHQLYALSLGVILSVSPLLLFLMYILLFKKLARTSEHLLILLFPSVSGYFITLAVFLMNNQQLTFMIGMMFAMSGFLITFLYIFWYSKNNRVHQEILENGQKLPIFTVNDSDGHSVSSQQFLGSKNLIFFYRGNWCPLCMAQINEVAKRYQQFEENNIGVIFIAPQPAEHTKQLADKFKLSFQFYHDEGNRAAEQLGIVHKFGLPMGFQALGYQSDSVYPTVLAINEQGVIIYNDQTDNYRIRPEPQELLKIFV